ncbi:MAG: efflux RND transporter permease subunit, partial [Deltaproteobacteria bacterium]|nr:efflux RND transporter permease subunit [Deltaproteobacteria bacterium]
MPDETQRDEEQPSGLTWIAIQRPISVVVGIVLVVLFGALSVVDLPIQLTPDIATPTITVSTAWPGAAPVEIETEIIEPQEEVLKNVQGLTRMESSASTNSGSITLEFEVDTVIAEALVRVTNKLSQVARYPESVREPIVETANSTGPPLAVIAIRDPKGRSVAAYRTWVADEILPEIDRIPGISGIFFFGGQNTEVHVLFDPKALAARGLSVKGVADGVRSELRDLSGGTLLGAHRHRPGDAHRARGSRPRCKQRWHPDSPRRRGHREVGASQARGGRDRPRPAGHGDAAFPRGGDERARGDPRVARSDRPTAARAIQPRGPADRNRRRPSRIHRRCARPGPTESAARCDVGHHRPVLVPANVWRVGGDQHCDPCVRVCDGARDAGRR